MSSYLGPSTSAYRPSSSSLPALPPAAPGPSAVVVPAGTLQPGTIVKVGNYTVTVDKFLSEGEPCMSLPHSSSLDRGRRVSGALVAVASP